MPFITPKTLPSEFVCRRVRIPENSEWLEIVNGALYELIQARNFEQIDESDLTPEQTAEVFQGMFFEYLESEVCMIGSLMLYATTAPPDRTLPCDGNSYLRVDYPKLYAVLSSQYIIDSDNFRTPNPVSHTGLNYYIVAK